MGWGGTYSTLQKVLAIPPSRESEALTDYLFLLALPSTLIWVPYLRVVVPELEE